MRILDIEEINGVVRIVVERRRWYWPWLRRREYIAHDKQNNNVCIWDDWKEVHIWHDTVTGEYVGDVLSYNLTCALTDLRTLRKLRSGLEAGYDNVISLDEKKAKRR